VGLRKGKFVIIFAGIVTAMNLLQPTLLLAENMQPDTKTGLNEESNPQDKTDLGGLSGRPETVSKAEGEIFYKMLLSVIVVIALGSGVIYVSKRVLPRFTNLPGKQIRVIETTHIAPRKGLHLVQVGVRRLLIASTNEHITMLADVTGAAKDFADELSSRTKEEK
jgi:flagellar biosynthetic protein FliO